MRVFLASCFLFLISCGCTSTKEPKSTLDFMEEVQLGACANNVIEGEHYDHMSGVKIEGQHVGFFDAGDWIEYRDVDFGTASRSLLLKVASDFSGGVAEVKIDSLDGPPIATITMSATGGWFHFKEVHIPIVNISGSHNVYFVGKKGNGIFNLDWFIFHPEEAPKGPLHVDKSKGEWTLVTVSDTQHYSQNIGKAPYSSMYQGFEWISSMKDQLNIKMVQGLGDVTQNWSDWDEWGRSSESWNLLEGVMPYMPTLGNHDDPNMMNRFFPVSRFKDKAWWGGDFGGIENNYFLMTVGNENYLFLHVECYDQYSKYRPEGIEWAKGILRQYPRHKVILATHDIWDTQHIKNKLLTQHDNIVMSNAGHTCAREKHFVTTGPNGGLSNNFVTDYQCDNPEVMLLRYYVFKPLEDRVDYFTYSPITGQFEKDGSSQGSFALLQIDPF